jgi:hypothetical protein
MAVETSQGLGIKHWQGLARAKTAGATAQKTILPHPSSTSEASTATDSCRATHPHPSHRSRQLPGTRRTSVYAIIDNGL